MTSSVVGPDPDRVAAFSRLVQLVSGCQRCPTMAGRRRLLSVRNGPVRARVLFVAEAPGRLGLEAQLTLVHAPIVATLGATALRALDSIAPHGLTLRAGVGQRSHWSNRLLVPLYHPNEQAMMTRPFARQLEDYQQLGWYVAELS